MAMLSAGNKSLALSLFKRTLFLSAILILILSAVHVWWEYESSLKSVRKSFTIIEETVSESVAADLWEFNEEKLFLHVQGLCHLPFISHAAVYEAGELLVESGKTPDDPPNELGQTFPLFIFYKGRKMNLGALTVQVDYREVMRRAYESALVGSMVSGGLILLVALLQFWLANAMVFKHLNKIAAHVRSISLKTKNAPLVLGKKNRGDELDALTRVLNTMQEELFEAYLKIVKSHNELQQSEERFRVLVEHAPDGVVVVDADTGKVVDANANALRIFNCSKEEIFSQRLRQRYSLVQPDGFAPR